MRLASFSAVYASAKLSYAGTRFMCPNQPAGVTNPES